MKRRRRKNPNRGDRPSNKRPKPLNSPFKGLAKLLAPGPVPRPRPAAEARIAREETAPDDPAAAFFAAVAGATRLPEGPRRIDVAPAGTQRGVVSAERAAAFADLMATSFSFDISDSEEYVEGAVVGLDPRLVRRLRRGEFSWQDYLDLHGMTVEEAKASVDGFLGKSLKAGLRCVLIVHGRGRNSLGQKPILKEKLKGWLSSGAHARSVLAFTTARPVDGGAGALYILLRRQKRRKYRMEVLEGAKR